MNKTVLTEIITLLKTGNVSTLKNIYQENRIPFIKFAKKYNLPKEDVIDIYQDAIIALRDNIVNGKVNKLNSTIRTYLFSIGKFMIFNKIKAYKNNKIINEEIINQNELVNHFDFYEEINTNNQQLVNKCFDQLSEKCQEVLKLFYYDGLTLKEIQEYLDYDNYNVVKSQKSRCLIKLREQINKQL